MSTYSDRLKLELMATGANANVWGTRTNNNLNVIEAFGAGFLAKSVAGSADVTLTTADSDATTESANKVIEFTGALTGNIKVFVPAVENNYIFFNNTTGSHTLTVCPTGHAANGVAITQGAHTIQYCIGNKIIDLFANSLGTVGVKNLVNVGSSAVKIEANGRLTATSFTGAGGDLTGVSTLPQNTQMVFLAASAPTGWTQNTAAALANSTLRVITSGTAGTGGSDVFGDTFGGSRTTETANIGLNVAPVTVDASSVSLGDTTLAIPTIASHTHPSTTTPTNQGNVGNGGSFFGSGGATGSTGGGGAHGHPMASASGSVSGTTNTPTSFTVPTMDVKHANAIVCSKD
tara:strand:+ start:5184 stop:6224 length:1041 start_codon:yes stop_codon:yes gene_type:complete